MSKEYEAAYLYLAEIVGTFLLVFIGCSVEASAVLTSGTTLTLPWRLLGWGIAYLIAIYVSGGISGAHLNWAVTLYLWLSRKFPGRHVPGYIVSQLIGAFLAAALIYTANYGLFMTADPAHTATTAYIFFGKVYAGLQFPYAFLIEAISAFLLVFVWQMVADERNPFSIGKFNPFIVFLYVVGIGLCFYPLTMVIMNPARDFGPRLFAYLIGYGTLAFPGTAGFELYNYVLAPIVGGLLGGFFYDLAFKPFWHRE